MTRRLLLPFLTLALVVLVPPATAAAGPLDLTGVVLSATTAYPDHGSMDVTASCDEDGTSMYSFTADGVAFGAYPGTFTAAGSGTVGPQSGSGVQVGALGDWVMTFSIESAGSTISGSVDLPAPGHLGGYCVTPGPGSPFSGLNLQVIGGTYVAIQDGGGAGLEDSGVADAFDSFLCSQACGDNLEIRFTSDDPAGVPPGPSQDIVVAPGDGAALVSWNPPLDDGGRAVTGYQVERSGPPGFQDTQFASPDLRTVVFGSLDNGTAYTFTVVAINAYGNGDPAVSSPVTPEAGLPIPATAAAVIPPGGGSATTDLGIPPGPDDQVVTTVAVPATAAGGTLTIVETSAGPAPSGFVFLGQQISIVSSAPTDASNPLVLTFRIDPALVPATIFRNGVPIDAPCNPAGTATPSPCVASGAGTSEITILSAAASTWNIGRRLTVFGGFQSPVDALPVVNSVKAGQAIPVKFSLGGDHGLAIFTTGWPKSQVVACDSTALVDGIEETVTAGSSTLSYHAGADRYQYTWKTEKSWANSCRQLVLRFLDGTTQRATFKFK